MLLKGSNYYWEEVTELEEPTIQCSEWISGTELLMFSECFMGKRASS